MKNGGVEWFVREKRELSEPRATFQVSGTLRFNAYATREFKLKQYRFAMLGFDREQRQVMVRFSKLPDLDYHVSTSAEGVNLSVRAFLNH